MPLHVPRQALVRAIGTLDGRLDLWRGLLRDLRQEQHRWAGGASAGELAWVKHVPDGDGVELVDGRRVRYLGIDAPEIGGESSPSAPWAEEAKAFNRRLVEGREVFLVRDVSDVDVHGRLLRYVFCDGMFVNAQLLLAGLARLMIIPPNTRYADLLTRCQAAAQQTGQGMWRRY